MKRLVPTLIVGAVIAALMYRGVGHAASEASANSNSSAIGAVDGAVQAPAQALGSGLPLTALVGALALIFAAALWGGR